MEDDIDQLESLLTSGKVETVNGNVIENEFQFMFECSLYTDLRIHYLDSYFYENPNHFK